MPPKYVFKGEGKGEGGMGTETFDQLCSLLLNHGYATVIK